MQAQQIFYVFGAIFFILFSIFLIVAIFAVMYIKAEINRVTRKFHGTMRGINGILEQSWDYVRTAEMSMVGRVLKNLLSIFK